MHTVVCQLWLESELGWGQRPDGYSLHKCVEDLNEFVKEYWLKMPKKVPNEYSRPDGNFYFALVDEATYNKINGNGMHVWDNHYPRRVDDESRNI